MLTVTFGLCQQRKPRVDLGTCLPGLHLPPVLAVWASRGAQSTVDGFYRIHTKNSPTALNVCRGTPDGRSLGHSGWLDGGGGWVAQMAEIRMSLLSPPAVYHVSVRSVT